MILLKRQAEIRKWISLRIYKFNPISQLPKIVRTASQALQSFFKKDATLNEKIIIKTKAQLKKDKHLIKKALFLKRGL